MSTEQPSGRPKSGLLKMFDSDTDEELKQQPPGPSQLHVTQEVTSLQI